MKTKRRECGEKENRAGGGERGRGRVHEWMSECGTEGGRRGREEGESLWKEGGRQDSHHSRVELRRDDRGQIMACGGGRDGREGGGASHLRRKVPNEREAEQRLIQRLKLTFGGIEASGGAIGLKPFQTTGRQHRRRPSPRRRGGRKGGGSVGIPAESDTVAALGREGESAARGKPTGGEATNTRKPAASTAASCHT
eukprot:scaffold114505_cov26-Tisochrysis_lutea.AAC.4